MSATAQITEAPVSEKDSSALDESAAADKKSGKHDLTGVADLEKVTDFVEEKEIAPNDLSNAMRFVQTQESNEKRKRELEYAKIKLNKEDIELIVREMEIPKYMAERKLREHGGNVVEALVDLSD